MTGAITEVLVDRVGDLSLIVVENAKRALQAIEARLGAHEAFRDEGRSLRFQQRLHH